MLSRKWSVLLLAPALLCLGAADPERYTAPDGKFSINFAKKPKVTEDKTPGGPMKLYAVESDPAQMVMVMENPILALANSPELAELALDKSRDGLVGKGKMLAEKKLKLNDKYTGRETLIQEEGGKAFMLIRMYLVDTNVIVVLVTGSSEEAVKSKDSVAFLDSFKLGKK